MIARIETEVPKNATPIEIEDALLYELNHGRIKKILHREEMERNTDLEGKCGACKYFVPNVCGSYGKCMNGRAMSPRTRRACRGYEKGEA